LGILIYEPITISKKEIDLMEERERERKEEVKCSLRFGGKEN